MKFDGWKELMEMNGWKLLFHKELKYERFPVIVMICTKHRQPWECKKCGQPPIELSRRLNILREIMRYPGTGNLYAPEDS